MRKVGLRDVAGTLRTGEWTDEGISTGTPAGLAPLGGSDEVVGEVEGVGMLRSEVREVQPVAVSDSHRFSKHEPESVFPRRV